MTLLPLVNSSVRSHQLRAATFALGAVAALVTKAPLHLLAVWFALASIIAIRGRFLTYGKMLVILAAPIATALAALLLFQYFLSPNNTIVTQSFQQQQLTPLLRLFVVVSLLHVVSIRLSIRDGVDFLGALRLPQDLVLVATSSLTLFPLMRKKVDEVLTARYARGLLKKRNPLSGIFQLPYTIRTLLAFSLTSADARASVWAHENTINRLHTHQRTSATRFDITILAPASVIMVWTAFELLRYGH